MNKQSPMFSVVIPAFNEERFIGACLESLRVQDFTGNFEIIVVDNNSTDLTSKVAAEHGAKVLFEPKRGVCAARQTGTEQALGEIVISADADTVYPPDWLSKIAVGFAQGADVVAVAGSCAFSNSPWWGKIYAKLLFGTVDLIYRRTGKLKYITASNTAFRKEFFSGYNINLTQGGDEFGLLKQLKDAGRIVFLPGNVAMTSSRRMKKGLFYNLFVTIFVYYIFDYWVSRIAGKSVLGSYAPIRKEYAPGNRYLGWLRTAAVTILALFMLTYVTDRAMAARIVHSTKVGIVTLEDRWGDKIHFHPLHRIK